MPVRASIPPGRAGRLWLRSRIQVAERGRDQLDHKLRLLLPEAQRLREAALRCRAEWTAAYQEAQTWLLRAGMVSGQDAVRHATPTAPAAMSVELTTTMGLTYPADVLVTAAGDAVLPPDNAAVAPAAKGFRAALAAGARTAAADEAVHRIETEIAVTRRRFRALDRRWLPYLRSSLAAIEFMLAQEEQDDGTRRRAVVGLRPVGSPGREQPFGNTA